MLRTIIVEQKSTRSGRAKTITRSIQCELSLARQVVRPRTDRAELLFKTTRKVLQAEAVEVQKPEVGDEGPPPGAND